MLLGGPTMLLLGFLGVQVSQSFESVKVDNVESLGSKKVASKLPTPTKAADFRFRRN
jgi:hypothetical protein